MNMEGNECTTMGEEDLTVRRIEILSDGILNTPSTLSLYMFIIQVYVQP